MIETKPNSNIKKRQIKNILKNILVILIGILLGLFLRAEVFEIVKVNGQSMYPTYNGNETVFVSKLFNSYERGDIVIFDSNDLFDSKYIKRVVGLPNEHIKINNGEVFINGVKLDEKYLISDTVGEIDMTIPEGSYFLMGDNRYDSKDSRIMGPIEEKRIIGEVKFNLTK